MQAVVAEVEEIRALRRAIHPEPEINREIAAEREVADGVSDVQIRIEREAARVGAELDLSIIDCR